MEQYCYYRNRLKIFHLRLLYIKNLNSIFDTESRNIYSIDSKKYIITKIECWPVFKQDPFLTFVDQHELHHLPRLELVAVQALAVVAHAVLAPHAVSSAGALQRRLVQQQRLSGQAEAQVVHLRGF